MKEVRLGIRLDKKLMEDLKAYAVDSDTPYSMIIRQAIKQYIKENKQ
ncbi:ribbon-helix-helix protein, CopG family [Deinococcus aquaticus]